jgi:phytoene dehydrogenase-like protein
MPMPPAAYDAAVIGAGPNGLAAALTLAQAGRSVVVFEAAETIGGGARSAPLTLPGFTHDVCSAIHPLGLASPFLRSLSLRESGLTWIHSPVPLAHPLDGGSAVLLTRDPQETADRLGSDGPSYLRMLAPLLRDWQGLLDDILGPLRPPRHPLHLARFGLRAIRSARGLAVARFRQTPARALLAGLGGHSMLPLEAAASAAAGLILAGLAHGVGWPMAAGGTQQIVEAMAQRLRALGGEVVTGRPITSLDELPPARAVLFNTSARQLDQIAGDALPAAYRRRLRRFRYGPGVFKMDWALDAPIPWAADACSQAATLHIGGTLEEIAAAEAAVGRGEHPDRPFIILSQQSLFDPSRAPAGKHTAWGYCHVPPGSTEDMTAHIEAQVERFAPGFRERILARHTRNAVQMESYNANYVGGDINSGLQDLRQIWTRPVPSLTPYATPVRSLYLCSSATPPGGGVHGMCGYHAARVALRRALSG